MERVLVPSGTEISCQIPDGPRGTMPAGVWASNIGGNCRRLLLVTGTEGQEKTLTGCACPPGTERQWEMVP